MLNLQAGAYIDFVVAWNGDTPADYNWTVVNATITSQATPIVTWTNPASMIYGTPLSSNQLNATANVPGSFVYNPPNGTVLNAGTNTLSVVFTPTDNVDYSSVTDSVSLVVLPAPLTVTASNASRAYGQINPLFTGRITGLQNSDNITATYATIAITNSPVGTYPIIPSLVDPNGRLVNYTAVTNNGTLLVTNAFTALSCGQTFTNTTTTNTDVDTYTYTGTAGQTLSFALWSLLANPRFAV